MFIIYNLHDFSMPQIKISDLKTNKNKTKVLFVFPHPDDEVFSSGGLMRKLSKDKRFEVFVLSITQGEKGKELLKITDNELAKIRETEYYQALKKIGSKNNLMWKYGDGNLINQQEDLKNELSEYISKQQFDLVVTFERTGMYGHKDHVVLSKIINQISKELKRFRVLYSTLPKKIEDRYNPKHRIKDLQLEQFDYNQQPEFRFFVGKSIFLKYIALRAYKSQNLSHFLPLWAKILLMPYEYYTYKYED